MNISSCFPPFSPFFEDGEEALTASSLQKLPSIEVYKDKENGSISSVTDNHSDTSNVPYSCVIS